MKKIITEKELIDIFNNCPCCDKSKYPKYCNKFNTNCMEHYLTCNYIRNQIKGATLEINIEYGNKIETYYI